MNAGIGLITEDRRGNGIFGCLSIMILRTFVCSVVIVGGLSEEESELAKTNPTNTNNTTAITAIIITFLFFIFIFLSIS